MMVHIPPEEICGYCGGEYQTHKPGSYQHAHTLKCGMSQVRFRTVAEASAEAAVSEEDREKARRELARMQPVNRGDLEDAIEALTIKMWGAPAADSDPGADTSGYIPILVMILRGIKGAGHGKRSYIHSQIKAIDLDAAAIYAGAEELLRLIGEAEKPKAPE